ncbi:NTP transferase domain-containing protein [Companilactobacillus keshanensis]|uniref:NTP transferase domain-containing protein n=1 Tax=Companilactobacillus keshanensis TaxID=2486003 RepID=A0ABW4BUC2_9LACO|nr:NTP transferase domain-containing protein [Companilactobacillus keshanensis]
MIDSLILAGGRSTRFKNDKALAHFNNVVIPNVKYTASLTIPFVNKCYVSTNENNYHMIQNLFSNDVTVMKDTEPMIDCGPMSAVWSYFKETNKEEVELLVIATDYIIDATAINFIRQDIGYIEIKQLPYYTCCHLKINIELLKRHINKKDYRWRTLLSEANCRPRNFSGYLKNINYPEDLQ